MATKKTAKKAPGRPKKAPDQKLEQFSIRLPPKLKYGLELLARAQNRSLSQAVEWALHVGLNSMEVRSDDNNSITLGVLVDAAWERKAEIDRLLLIYSWAPTLMSFEEFSACQLLEESAERVELFELPDLGDAGEEDLFFSFCRATWPAIREIAEKRANAGLPTKGESLLKALGFSGRGDFPYRLELYKRVVSEHGEKPPMSLAEITSLAESLSFPKRERRSAGNE